MMAQQLRALSVLAEHPGSVSSIHGSWLVVTTIPRDVISFLASAGTRDTPGAHAGKYT